MLDNDVILVGSSTSAQSILKEIKAKSTFYQHYKFIHVPCDKAANVLSFNGRIVAPVAYRGQCEHIPELVNNPKVVWIEAGEFEKIDGCLSCRSVFFNDGN